VAGTHERNGKPWKTRAAGTHERNETLRTPSTRDDASISTRRLSRRSGLGQPCRASSVLASASPHEIRLTSSRICNSGAPSLCLQPPRLARRRRPRLVPGNDGGSPSASAQLTKKRRCKTSGRCRHQTPRAGFPRHC
jgi:hypothetical protein